MSNIGSLSPDTLSKVKALVENQKILLIDKNQIARDHLVSMLMDIGAERENIYFAGEVDRAVLALKEYKPSILICDESISHEKAVDLFEIFRGNRQREDSKIFLFLTKNSSQAGVGKVAEDDFDGFLLKPYSKKLFYLVFSDLVQKRLFPSEYQKKLSEGKDQLFRGEIDLALSTLEEARKMNESPTQALFYIGQALAMKTVYESAKANYQQGIQINEIHFKCLQGLFDLLSQEKKELDAYEVLRRLVTVYPKNTKRLSLALTLAVKTKNFRDVEGFYDIFSSIDDHTVDLVSHMCAALAVNGRFHLMHAEKDSAIVSFERALEHGGDQVKYVNYVSESLIKYGFVKEASDFLERFMKKTA